MNFSSEATHKMMEALALFAGVFVCFGATCYLEEAVIRFPGFTFGWFLGFLEIIGVTVCCSFEMYATQEFSRKSSLKSYLYCTACLMISVSLSNISLNYISYPVKVIFRSFKLIPTMLIAIVVNKKRYIWGEYLAAFSMVIGLSLFGIADAQTSPSFNALGIGLVSMSVFGDAILPNLQEQSFKAGSSRLEVMFWTNLFSSAFLLPMLGWSGDLQGGIMFGARNGEAALCMLTYTFVAYIAITLHTLVVERYGAVVAVIVGNSRKAMTVVISFIVFPKPISIYHILGGTLVFGGVVTSVIFKEYFKKPKVCNPPLNLKPNPTCSSEPDECPYLYI